MKISILLGLTISLVGCANESYRAWETDNSFIYEKMAIECIHKYGGRVVSPPRPEGKEGVNNHQMRDSVCVSAKQ